jgi:hypothetical protein
MFRLASIALSDQVVLIVESDAETASRMADDVARSGGTVIATVPDISSMLAVIANAPRVDSVMAAAQTLALAPVFVPEWLHSRGMQLVVITSWDDWFLGEDAVDDR